MKNEITQTGDWTSRIAKRALRMAYWTAAWVVSTALGVFGPQFLWSSKALTFAALLINLGFGVGMIIAFKGWLAEQDELQKKIQLESLAIALGVGIVGGLGYSMMDITNLIPFDAEIAFLVILMSLTYIAGILVNTNRYK